MQEGDNRGADVQARTGLRGGPGGGGGGGGGHQSRQQGEEAPPPPPPPPPQTQARRGQGERTQTPQVLRGPC